MHQSNFFQPVRETLLSDESGCVIFIPQALSVREADNLFVGLRKEIEWRQEKVFISGRWIDIPRLQAWYGASEAIYRYSGLAMTPLPWSERLLGVKERIEELSNCTFNSVLLNLYRDGKDGVGWHSDDEPELGPQPIIASLSLGADRYFSLKEKRNEGRKLKFVLPHGSLLMMSGALQEKWQHQLPKTALTVGERINLTFRCIKN